MNLITIFQFLIKLAFLLLLAFFPLHELFAQAAAAEGEQKVYIKVTQTIDGKTFKIDTTFTGKDNEALRTAILEAKLDTVNFPMLRSVVRSYTLGNGENVHLRGAKFDTLLAKRAGDTRLRFLITDSLRLEGERNLEIIRVDGKATTLHGAPSFRTRVGKDTIRVFGLGELKELKELKALHPSEIERIVVARGTGTLKVDSLLRREGKNYIRIKTDEANGNHQVYRIEADGSEVRVDPADINLGIANGPRMVYIIRKTKVEDMSVADKEQLKAAGAAVETKAKEELKMEEISYYPNPSNGRFNLKFSLKNKGTTVVRILNDKGQEVFVDTVEKFSGEYERQIDLSPYGPGMYFLQVAQGNRYHTKKLIMQ